MEAKILDRKSTLRDSLLDQTINPGACFPSGFEVDGEVSGIITITITTIDELFMQVQYYFNKVVNRAKQLGTVGVVVNLEGRTNSKDWTSLIEGYGFSKSKGSDDIYIASRNDLNTDLN